MQFVITVGLNRPIGLYSSVKLGNFPHVASLTDDEAIYTMANQVCYIDPATVGEKNAVHYVDALPEIETLSAVYQESETKTKKEKVSRHVSSRREVKRLSEGASLWPYSFRPPE